MRMWNVPVECLCREHLLGEHVEMHMFVGFLKRNRSVSGFVEGGLVELENIKLRHDLLAREMLVRGYTHASPLLLTGNHTGGKVDTAANLIELARRCPACRLRISKIRKDSNA